MTKSIITTLLLVATMHTQAQIRTNEGICYLKRTGHYSRRGREEKI